MVVRYTKTVAVIPLSNTCCQMHPKSQFADINKCLILKLTGLIFFKNYFEFLHRFTISIYPTKLLDSYQLFLNPNICMSV